MNNSKSKEINQKIKPASVKIKELGEKKNILWIMQVQNRKNAQTLLMFEYSEFCRCKILLNLPNYKCCMVTVRSYFEISD